MLPAGAFSWKVLLVHGTHTHDFTTVTGSRTGSFVVPTTGHVDSTKRSAWISRSPTPAACGT